MRRTIDVARIQLFNGLVVYGIPVLVLATAWLINLVIFASTGSNSPDGNTTGGLMSIYILMLVAHLQTMTQLFPFAAGLSVTRWTFFGATTLVIAGQGLVYGVLLHVLRLLEEATGGWGLHLSFFGLPFVTRENPLLQVAVYAAPFLLMGFLGAWLGTVFKRWGAVGMYVLGIGAALLVMAVLSLIGWQGWWPQVGRFFAAQSELALLIGYPLGFAALLAGACYLTMRRAVP